MNTTGAHQPQSFSSRSKYEQDKARFLLAVACLWPLLLLALVTSSSPHVAVSVHSSANASTDNKEDEAAAALRLLEEDAVDDENEGESHNSVRLSLRNVLDRVDIMGYGPTHPRIGIVVTGPAHPTNKDKHHFVSTVESIFAQTDMARIFVVTVVVDGLASTHHAEWQADLHKIQSGQIPHWHGLRPDLHSANNEKNENNEDASHHAMLHDSKVHVMFNEEPLGITACRQDGADFIHILSKHHEGAGLKSTDEDTLLLLVQAGTVLTSRQWLPTVTQALIVPPPLVPPSRHARGQGQEPGVANRKMANAISFRIADHGASPQQERMTVDAFWTPQLESVPAEELNQSNGASYMAPIWNGAALALRLETYRQLPIHDMALTEAWPANLDLSLALWLCADGMDIVIAGAGDEDNHQQDNSQGGKDALTVTLMDPSLNPTTVVTAPLPPPMAARLAEAWMDEGLQRQFFSYYTTNITTYQQVTYVEWQTYQAQARQSSTFVSDLVQKCRSMEWYIRQVNAQGLLPILEQKPIQETPKEKKQPPKENNQDSDNKKEETAKEQEVQPVMEQDEENSVAIPERRELKKPSQPLCEECLQIVEKAQPINLQKVDMSGGHQDHPHLGAKDADGNLGYVHDETNLHRNPPSFNMDKNDLVNACSRKDNNYKMLTEKVFVDVEGDAQATRDLGGPENRVKLFCLVYTTEKGHDNLPRIRETWGQKCDGFMVGSTKTDPSLDTVEIPHEGPEEYDNIWQKVRSMWSYIYDNYYDKYDWFHIGGDDYYLLVENLKLYLESEEIRTAQNGMLLVALFPLCYCCCMLSHVAFFCF